MKASTYTLRKTDPRHDRELTKHEFLRELIAESRNHPAIHHPWLRAFAAGTLPDPERALRDFAVHYHGYSTWFPRYLRAVIESLADPHHRALLAHNLEEEQGRLGSEERDQLQAIGIDPTSVDGVPHPKLFRRFCDAVGVTAGELASPPASAVRWRTAFAQFLTQASPAAAVGALGLGTEHIVKPIYEQVLRGIRRLDTLSRGDYVFFELHCIVDDQHQQDLFDIATDLARDARARAEIRNGMRYALDLRMNFFDELHSSACRLGKAAGA